MLSTHPEPGAGSNVEVHRGEHASTGLNLIGSKNASCLAATYTSLAYISVSFWIPQGAEKTQRKSFQIMADPRQRTIIKVSGLTSAREI